MGKSHDDKITELVWSHILDTLKGHNHPHRSDFYRDVGLSYFMDSFRKDLIKIFKEFGLPIEVTTNMITFSFLDVTFDLNTEKY